MCAVYACCIRVDYVCYLNLLYAGNPVSEIVESGFSFKLYLALFQGCLQLV